MTTATDEKAIRAARRKLRARLDSALKTVDKVNQKLSDLIHDAVAYGRTLWPCDVDPVEKSLAAASATFRARRLDLELFDAAHGIADATYPGLPELDRMATKAAGIAARERMRAEIRARMERDGLLPRTTPT